MKVSLDKNGRCATCGGDVTCKSCGAGVGELIACEEPNCGPLQCPGCERTEKEAKP